MTNVAHIHEVSLKNVSGQLTIQSITTDHMKLYNHASNSNWNQARTWVVCRDQQISMRHLPLAKRGSEFIVCILPDNDHVVKVNQRTWKLFWYTDYMVVRSYSTSHLYHIRPWQLRSTVDFKMKETDYLGQHQSYDTEKLWWSIDLYTWSLCIILSSTW